MAEPLDVAAVNASLLDAGKSLDQARGALGSGDSAMALYRLHKARETIIRAMTAIRDDDAGTGATKYGCYYCGRTVSEVVHLANTAYACRMCFEKYKPEPMPRLEL